MDGFVGLVQLVGLGVGVAVGRGVGVDVGPGVGVAVGGGVGVEVGVGPGGVVGVGVGCLLSGLKRTMAKQRAWPRATAPHAWTNEYPPLSGAAEAAPALLASTRAVTLSEKMATSVARMRAPRRMPDNPSCAHADNMRHSAPSLAGHATQGYPTPSPSKEMPGSLNQTGADGLRCGTRVGAWCRPG